MKRCRSRSTVAGNGRTGHVALRNTKVRHPTRRLLHRVRYELLFLVCRTPRLRLIRRRTRPRPHSPSRRLSLRRLRVRIGRILRPSSLTVANAVLVFPIRIRRRCVDKHADLAGRIHDVLANRLLLLQRRDDVVESLRAVHLFIVDLTLPLISNIVVVYPTAKPLLSLLKQAVENLVCVRLHEVGRVVRIEHPALHRDGAGIVFGPLTARHGVVDALDVPLAVSFDLGDGFVGVGRDVGFAIETRGQATMVASMLGSRESALKGGVFGLSRGILLVCGCCVL